MIPTTAVEITYTLTATGNHMATARFPLHVAFTARHLPNLTHEGRTYVPYTGTVITADRMQKYGRPIGYYMEYRALRDISLLA
jgi:hypothetical protein